MATLLWLFIEITAGLGCIALGLAVFVMRPPLLRLPAHDIGKDDRID